MYVFSYDNAGAIYFSSLVTDIGANLDEGMGVLLVSPSDQAKPIEAHMQDYESSRRCFDINGVDDSPFGIGELEILYNNRTKAPIIYPLKAEAVHQLAALSAIEISQNLEPVKTWGIMVDQEDFKWFGFNSNYQAFNEENMNVLSNQISECKEKPEAQQVLSRAYLSQRKFEHFEDLAITALEKGVEAVVIAHPENNASTHCKTIQAASELELATK